MKVLGICGSPQEGNTKRLLTWILDSCRARDAQTEIIKISDFDIKFCNGCGVCYGSERPCVINDDMEQLLSKMLEVDAIVFGSPNYFDNVTGLMKNFIDRTNPLSDPQLLKGKATAIVCVGARAIEETKVVVQILEKYCEVMGVLPVGSVIAQAEDPGDVDRQEDTKLACIDLGNNIMDKLVG
ncbi:MAG: flavodoxin family protein [Candidatus Woesearchaeota archaeon]